MKYLLFCYVAALAVSAGAAATCFYPDGSTTEPSHKPCNTTVTNSACCDPLDTCTTSGLCLGRTAFNYRGSCTDSTWQDPACPSACHTDPFTKLPYSTFTMLWPCDAPGGPSTDFCCNSPNRNCCTISTFKYGTTGDAFKGGMDQLFLELSQNTANNASSQPATVTVTATAAAGAASAASGTASSTASLTSSSKSSNVGPIIGAAVGAPLGILVLGLLAFLFYRSRRSTSTSTPAPIELAKPYPHPDYYQQSEPQPPRPPPIEAPGWQGGGAQADLSRANTLNAMSGYDKKSPVFGVGPAGVHELI